MISSQGGEFFSDVSVDGQSAQAPAAPGCFAVRINGGTPLKMNGVQGASFPMTMTDITSDPAFGAVAVGTHSSFSTAFGTGSEKRTFLSANSQDGYVWTLDGAGEHLQAVNLGGIGIQNANAVTSDSHGFKSVGGTFDSFAFPRKSSDNVETTTLGGRDAFLFRHYFHPLPSLQIFQPNAATIAVSFTGLKGHSYTMLKSPDLRSTSKRVPVPERHRIHLVAHRPRSHRRRPEIILHTDPRFTRRLGESPRFNGKKIPCTLTNAGKCKLPLLTISKCGRFAQLYKHHNGARSGSVTELSDSTESRSNGSNFNSGNDNSGKFRAGVDNRWFGNALQTFIELVEQIAEIDLLFYPNSEVGVSLSASRH